MNHRQHHPDGNKQLADMMARFFHPPNKYRRTWSSLVAFSPLLPASHLLSTNKTQQFMDFIYLTQVVQAICIGGQAEHYRRLLSESKAYTRGTLYWQLVGGCGLHYHHNPSSSGSGVCVCVDIRMTSGRPRLGHLWNTLVAGSFSTML